MSGTKSIKDIFLEMKDTSELMVDLAYSALLYDNKEIAKEVMLLEEHVDELNEKVQEMAIEGAIEDHNVNKALVMIGLCNSIEMIADSAMGIADVVLRDIEPHPILMMSFRDTEEIITRAKIKPKSQLVGKTLGELKLGSKTGMRVIAIRRNVGWIYDPNKRMTLELGDYLIATGPREGKDDFLKLAAGLCALE